MDIYGLKCLVCGDGNLQTLNVINGTIHTQCLQCGHIARPEPKVINRNQVYSKFAKKSVEVEYSRQKNTPAQSVLSKSGTFERTHFASAGLRKCS